MKMKSSQNQRIAAGGGAVRRWNRRRVSIVMGTLLAGITLLATATPASATCFNGVYDEAMPITASSPPDGTSMVASGVSPIKFSIRTPVHGGEIAVEVATQNVPGQDGTLALDYATDSGQMFQSDADPDLHAGTSHFGSGWWTDTPGTYYWQAHTVSSDSLTGQFGCHMYKSPVYTLTITAPPPSDGGSPPTGNGGTTGSPPTGNGGTTGIGGGSPPPPTIRPSSPHLSFGNAKSDAAYMVNSQTHKHPRLFRGCSRINRSTIHCQLAWLAGRYSYSAAGKFWSYVGSDGNAYWWYDFSGKRTWRTCAARQRCSHHSQRFHWH